MTLFLKRVFVCSIGAGLILPFLIVAGVSVNSASNISFPPQELSLQWYTQLLTEPDWLRPIRNSLVIAFFAGLIAVSIALAANYVLWRLKSGFGKLVFGLGLGPFMLPPIIIAMGASVFWAEMGWYGRAEATVISHGVFFVTLPLVIIARGFAALSDDVIEASRTMGATPWQTFAKVIFPLVLPYAITGYALVAIISVNEYLISYMVSGFAVETLPIRIFNNVRYGYTPVVASAAMGFALLTIGTLLVLSMFTDLLKLLGASRD
ncbi:putative spermidine/putrescine transport system permease protein [Epibacterium ulvae]|uniref:Putative spermidine/putrescine transport system permease protein n=1 Tax=Epibacterium ulvae TaxID=1156985 RepID=A0A1G5PI87_9RHOB|nr:ABC transporter permease [Epibacterium ulvae]SCZ49187.1 putative spermidine/putrescine transport system permease protein [Epibacterium ulvae]